MNTDETTQAKRCLKPDDVKQIRSACLTEAFPTYLQQRNYAMVTLLADSGLRVSELVALDDDDLALDAERPHIYIPIRSRRVALATRPSIWTTGATPTAPATP